MAFGEAGDVRLRALKAGESYQCSSLTVWILAVAPRLLLESLTLSFHCKPSIRSVIQQRAESLGQLLLWGRIFSATETRGCSSVGGR